MGVRQVFTCDLSGAESDNVEDFLIIQIMTGGEVKEFFVHEDVTKDELEEGESVLARLMFKDD